MSDEERDAIEREMEQCAAEEAARAEAEAEAERAMSDGKVICSEASTCPEEYLKYCWHGEPHDRHEHCSQTCRRISSVQCVPVSGKEAQDEK